MHASITSRKLTHLVVLNRPCQYCVWIAALSSFHHVLNQQKGATRHSLPDMYAKVRRIARVEEEGSVLIYSGAKEATTGIRGFCHGSSLYATVC
jgi:hypothetical protein